MFHRELRLNFGELERAADALDWYGQMLARLKEGLQLFGNAIEGDEGEANAALMRKVRQVIDMIVRELAAVGDTRDILRSYIRDMTAVISPDIWGQPMVVDRNDIWANLMTMAERIGHLACLPYYARVYSMNVCTLNPDAKTKRAEEGYYRRVQEVLTDIIPPYFARIQSIFGELQQIYEEKVVAFENIDDEYLWIADSNYQKHQEFCDVLGNAGMVFVDMVGDFVTGAANGIWDTVVGSVPTNGSIFYPIAAGAVYAFCDKIDLEPPEWAREEIESIETNGGAILKDPLLLVEGPAQAVTDAVEQKGIAYCAGYVAGPIIVAKGIAEGISKVKTVRNKARAGKTRITEDGGRAAENGNNSINYTYDPKKIGKQMGKRGWTEEAIQETLNNPVRTVKTCDTRWLPGADGPLNDPATAYYASDGSYVVRNDKTGVIIQISNKNDPNWIAPWDVAN